MTDDTTTIEITESQRDQLKDRKQHPAESYKAVVGRLLSGDEPTGDVDVSAIVEKLERIESAQGNTVSKAIELAENDMPELMDKLDRIERAATTAEERTNAIAKELEDMRR